MTIVLPGADREPPRPFVATKLSVGAVGRETWQVFRRRPWTFVGFVILPLLVSVCAGVLVVLIKGHGLAGAISVLCSIAQAVVQIVCQNAALYGAGQIAGGSDFRMGQAIKVGSQRFFPCLGTSLVMMILVALGFLALVFPAYMAICALNVAPPACVIERLGPLAALDRSMSLTSGNRWRVAGVLLVVVFLPLVAVFTVASLVIAFLVALHLPILAIVTGVVFFAAFMGLAGIWMIVPSVLFVALRSIKEGPGAATA